jgi:DNA polymerase-3 subunit gamma/tau
VQLFEEPISTPSPYYVLARRYRPHFFKEVIGQELFVQMIKNALKENRLGHGLLLTGIRGIGKTTLARLIAKALLCTNRQEAEPCGTCDACLSFSQDKHLDVVEMDAASHTGVEDMRALIEACQYRGVMSAYRIYIIDEVHMLSKSAFHALLKTLEEPPPHVKFILATTETGKIPPTILSRCQQFHLSPLPTETLFQHLKAICQNENVEFEEEALYALAKSAEGGARNALSLLEQALLISRDKKICLKEVRHLLGLAHQDSIEHLFQAVLQKDLSKILAILEECQREGISANALAEGLLDLLHHHMKTALVAPRKNNVDIPHLWQIAHRGCEDTLRSTAPYRTFEMTLLRMMYAASLPSVEELFSSLKNGQAPKAVTESSAPSASCHPSLSTTTSPSSAVSVPQRTFPALLSYAKETREVKLLAYLTHSLSFVSWTQETLTLHWTETAPLPETLKSSLEALVRRFTGGQDRLCFSDTGGEETWATQEKKKAEEKRQHLLQDPLVQSAQSLFEGSVIENLGSDLFKP